MNKFIHHIRGAAWGLALAAMPTVAGCVPTEINWEEEIKLHDGKIIVLKRHEELGLSGFPLAHRGSRKYWHFCYAPMNIIWKSKPEYFPEVFDIADGRAYVRVTIGSCITCKLHDFPETSALYFMWNGSAWKKIDYKEFPPGLRVNLLGNTHYDDDGARDVKGLITVEQKIEREPTIYWLMRKKPEVVGLNDWVTYRGGNQPPVYAKDACNECRKLQRIETNATDEVFLPADSRDCK